MCRLKGVFKWVKKIQTPQIPQLKVAAIFRLNPNIHRRFEAKQASMGIENDENSEGITEIAKNGLHLYPVSAQSSGEGLPYAPIDWPQPGDKWRWKVGNRTAASGHFMDRYLYLPKRLQSKPKGGSFKSKLSVEQYVRTYADADVDAFFSSFSWRIPSVDGPAMKAEHSGSESQPEIGGCKAGNRSCRSLVESEEASSATAFCDICCSEPNFCGDCCCILCSKTVDSAYESYGFIRCEGATDGDVICGHVAHIECGTRCYMAGTVGGSIGLDAEYYCRRCDKRTDLLSHVTKFLQTCQSVESRDDIMKILNLGTCILRDSRRHKAKKLLHHIELVIRKLKSGACLEDVWKVEDGSAVDPESAEDDKPADTRAASPQKESESFNPVIESLKLEMEVDQILRDLKRSQESEYYTAQERLYEQKNYIQDLYQQLAEEKAELARHADYPADTDTFFKLVANRVDQIKREVIRLKELEEVAKGFGRTPKKILKEHFGLDRRHG